MIFFDTDYMEGAHPAVMKRLMDTNLEHTVGYGNDPYTLEAIEAIRKACAAPQALVRFLPGGTQTNATVIDGLLSRHEGVLAAHTAHINAHESGAVEHSGHKVLTLTGKSGKLDAQQVDAYIEDFYSDDTFEHMVAPGMVYISQPTECGTLYSLAELEALSGVCHKHNIPLYMDGARLGYGLACPAADFTLKDIARLCDVFYIGGTKCGLLFGEAVVAACPERLPHFLPLVKQHGGLTAKGRLLGVQFGTLFRSAEGDCDASASLCGIKGSASLCGMEGPAKRATEGSTLLYQSICRHAVTLALQIKDAFAKAGYRIAIDSPTNQQFFILPNEVMDRLRSNGVSFENWGPRGKEETTVRFVTSWATSDEDVNALIELL